MRRTSYRALQGLALSTGAPLGWLVIQVVSGTSAQAAVTAQPGLYLYMLIATAAAFGLFGALLGGRESRLLQTNEGLEEVAVTDALTGLRNARYFHTRLAEEHAETKRTGKPLGVVVLDLDHFKRVNDEHGHLVGDDVLTNTGRAIASITRQGETEARVGGEEFGLLLPDSTSEEAREVAERVREAIGASETRLPGPQGGTVHITASAGVASTADFPVASAEELLRTADAAMYRAKEEGRNRTVVAKA